MKVKYIEEKPIKREIIFENYREFYLFWEEYFNKLSNQYGYKINEYYKYEQFKLTKAGFRRKQYVPKPLTQEQREKCLKRTIVIAEKNKQIRLEKINKVIKVLNNHFKGVELKRYPSGSYVLLIRDNFEVKK